ncbi:MAG TPA: DUF2142 domain-containing protein [Thermoanaerobaculia bacterium]
MTPQRVFLILGAVFGLLFTFLTPAFRVPDEVTHFWRPVSMAYGTLVPTMTAKGGEAPVPMGYRTLVWIAIRGDGPNGKVNRDDMRIIPRVNLEPEQTATVSFVASYTPVPYAPQLAAALLGRAFALRPPHVFYLGRLFNLAAFLAIVAFAIRTTPAVPWGFCTIGLFPMSLYLAASWSPDTMTVACALAVTAVALRGARAAKPLTGNRSEPVFAFLLGLCKPGYSHLAFLALPKKRWVGMIAAVVGTALSLWWLSRSPIGTGAQWPCIQADPLRALGVLTSDLTGNAFLYFEEAVGRLGMLDVFLPPFVIWAELALLVLIALTASDRVAWGERVMALLIFISAALFIMLSMYMAWTKPCATNVEGIQGRYFLPILVLPLVALANPAWKWRKVGWPLVMLVAITANVLAAIAIRLRYF